MNILGSIGDLIGDYLEDNGKEPTNEELRRNRGEGNYQTERYNMVNTTPVSHHRYQSEYNPYNPLNDNLAYESQYNGLGVDNNLQELAYLHRQVEQLCIMLEAERMLTHKLAAEAHGYTKNDVYNLRRQAVISVQRNRANMNNYNEGHDRSDRSKRNDDNDGFDLSDIAKGLKDLFT